MTQLEWPNMNSHPQLRRQWICWKTPKGRTPQDHWDCPQGTLAGAQLLHKLLSISFIDFQTSEISAHKRRTDFPGPNQTGDRESTRNSLDSSHHSWCKMLRYIQVWYNDNILMTYDWHMCMWYDLYHMSYVANMKLCQSTIPWCLPRQPPRRVHIKRFIHPEFAWKGTWKIWKVVVCSNVHHCKRLSICWRHQLLMKIPNPGSGESLTRVSTWRKNH